MTLDEALAWADCHGDDWGGYSDQAAVVLAAEVRRLKSPRAGVCQIGPPKQIAPTNWPAWGIDERELLRRAMMNTQPPIKDDRFGVERWVSVKRTFGVGSTVAFAMFREFGLDPDTKVKK